MIAEQFFHASDPGGDDRDLTGHNLPRLLGEAVSTKVVFPVADDGNLKGVQEERNFFQGEVAEVDDPRQLGNLYIPRACENKLQVRILGFQRLKGVKQRAYAAVSKNSSRSSYERSRKREVEFFPAKILVERFENVLSNGVLQNVQRTISSIRFHEFCKRLADAGYTAAFTGYHSIELLEDGQARREVIFEIIVKVKDERDTIFPGQDMADDSVKRIRTRPYPIRVRREPVGLSDEGRKARQFEGCGVDASPKNVAVPRLSFLPQLITEAEAAYFMAPQSEGHGDLSETTESIIQEVLAHILAFCEDKDAQMNSLCQNAIRRIT